MSGYASVVRLGACLVAALLLGACPETPEKIPEPDGGSAGADAGAALQPVARPTGGGAELQSPNYKLEISVGVPAPVGSAQSGARSLNLGTGAARAKP